MLQGTSQGAKAGDIEMQPQPELSITSAEGLEVGDEGKVLFQKKNIYIFRFYLVLEQRKGETNYVVSYVTYRVHFI